MTPLLNSKLCWPAEPTLGAVCTSFTWSLFLCVSAAAVSDSELSPVFCYQHILWSHWKCSTGWIRSRLSGTIFTSLETPWFYLMPRKRKTTIITPSACSTTSTAAAQWLFVCVCFFVMMVVRLYALESVWYSAGLQSLVSDVVLMLILCKFKGTLRKGWKERKDMHLSTCHVTWGADKENNKNGTAVVQQRKQREFRSLNWLRNTKERWSNVNLFFLRGNVRLTHLTLNEWNMSCRIKFYSGRWMESFARL